MLAGLGTTAATMALFTIFDGLDVIHWHGRLVPHGALTLGLLAGSGYGVAGFFLTRLRFTVGMLAFIAASMVVCYVGIQVLDWLTAAPELGFFDYFDALASHSALVGEGGVEELSAVVGYGYRLRELVALVLGGVLGCAVVPMFGASLRRR